MTSGRVMDFALGVLALEALVLWLLRRRRQGGLGLVDVVGHLSAGALLLLAVRSAVVGAPWTWTGAFLLASFPAHVFDLQRRWRSGSARES